MASSKVFDQIKTNLHRPVSLAELLHGCSGEGEEAERRADLKRLVDDGKIGTAQYGQSTVTVYWWHPPGAPHLSQSDSEDVMVSEDRPSLERQYASLLQERSTLTTLGA